MHPKISPLRNTSGLKITDPIENHHCTIFTDNEVTPIPVDTQNFPATVDVVNRIQATSLRFPNTSSIDVRDPDRSHYESIEPTTTRNFRSGEYLLELHPAVKLYLRVTGAPSIEVTNGKVSIKFDQKTTVEIGARSYHSDSTATITVPDNPEAVMEAVSMFSASLETTSPERAWPTKREHPPRIEHGNTLHVPATLEPANTNITIEIPPEYATIYTVAPLAYYLGADIQPATTAQVTASTDEIFNLGNTPSEIADNAAALLKRVFLLDAATRTEGEYPVDLYEREILEAKTNLDFARLYRTTPAERLRRYLDVPDEDLDAITPEWHETAYLPASVEAAELLPFVVNDLAVVQVPEVTATIPSTEDPKPGLEGTLDLFTRGESPTTAFTRSSESRLARTPANSSNKDGRDKPYVKLPDGEEREQVWGGSATPVNGTDLIPEAFDYAVPTQSEAVNVTVVCNDSAMAEERVAVTDIYNSRESVMVDVNPVFDASTGELADLIEDDCDLLHFIGHVEDDGLLCHDGRLDVGSLDSTGATTVLLNGCRSQHQGKELVNAGANAAIVSLGDVWNSTAVLVGETIAHLLNHGFTVGSAFNIVMDYVVSARNYTVLGDPTVTVAQCNSVEPLLYRVSDTDHEARESEVEVTPVAYPTQAPGVGTVVQPCLPGFDKYHIGIGELKSETVSRDTLYTRLDGNSDPVVENGELLLGDQ